MRPLLELHVDGTEKTQAGLRERLASQFNLTSEELEERIPSGLANTFANRVAWASTHMKQAALIEKPRRGVSVITDRGREALAQNSEVIGALKDADAGKGVFITTSSFSAEARDLGRRQRVVLLDGAELAALMADAGVGVTTLRRFEIKRIDEDYFAGPD